MPLANNSTISIRNVSVTRDNVEIIKNITAEIHSGEVAAIIGPNGAGKTTLLKCLLDLIDYSGNITVFGEPPKKALGKIGYVPQRFSFDKNFPLTVLEFLRLSILNQHSIEEALAEVEMEKYKNMRLGKLSGGQLQRVLIARAIMNKPKLLLLDEPTAGIDLEGEKDFYEIIQDQNRSHQTTVVMISHEVNMVYSYATQVICLNKSLYCVGKPKDAITREVLSKLYGSDVSMRKEHKH